MTGAPALIGPLASVPVEAVMPEAAWMDHIGAEHGELIGRERSGEDVRAIQDFDAFKWAHGCLRFRAV